MEGEILAELLVLKAPRGKEPGAATDPTQRELGDSSEVIMNENTGMVI